MKRMEEMTHTERLREEVERVLGIHLATPKDFMLCRDAIFEKVHVNISISTLKRFWGYVATSKEYFPNRYTLDALAQYVGFANFKAFCEAPKVPDSPNIKDLLDYSIQQISVLEYNLKALRRMLKDNKEPYKH